MTINITTYYRDNSEHLTRAAACLVRFRRLSPEDKKRIKYFEVSSPIDTGEIEERYHWPWNMARQGGFQDS